MLREDKEEDVSNYWVTLSKLQIERCSIRSLTGELGLEDAVEVS